MNKYFLISLFFGASVFSTNSEANSAVFDAIMACSVSPEEPGIVVRIEQNGQLVYNGASGISNKETKRSLSINDIFQIGSITKQFTAAAILLLSEKNKLRQQDKLGQFIPNLDPTYAHLTIARLLSHTAGLSDYMNEPIITQQWHQYASIDHIIEQINKIPVHTTPGEEYIYSNIGYILLGKVIEVVSGKPYDQFLQEYIFTPLKMNNTYVMTKGKTVAQVKGYSHKDEKPMLVDRSWIYAAGAIASTLSDMSRWHQALKSGEVITAQSYQLMTTKAHLKTGKTVNYGFGLDIYPISKRHTYSHQGGVPGFMAWSIYFPQDDLFATAFTNNDRLHPGPILLNMIAVQLNLSPQPVKGEKINLFAKQLVGEYQFQNSKKIKITAEGDQLFSQLEGENKRRIIPRENNSYSYECTEDYYELRQQTDKTELVPVKIYYGEQSALIKISK